MATQANARKTSNDTLVVDADVVTKSGAVDADAEINLSAVRRPFYAYVGAADFAVEKLRTLPSTYAQRLAEVQASVKQAQGTAKSSAKNTSVAVREQLNQLPEKARAFYTEFVVRGQKVVEGIRSNPDAQAAVNQAKAAVGEAKDSATHAKRSAKAGAKAAEETADQAG